MEVNCRAVPFLSGWFEQMSRCMQNELDTCDKLAQEWTQFSTEDEARCFDLTNIVAPSYTDLPTCLGLARDACLHGDHVVE